MTVTRSDISHGVRELCLSGLPVCLHVSLRSFGGIDGGPAALVDGVLDEGCTVLIPAFSNQAFDIPAPPDDRPARNGIDYGAKEQSNRPWPGESDVYSPNRVEVDSWLGATAAHVAARSDRVRGTDPIGSFSALGPLTDKLMRDDPMDSFGPLRSLSESGGWVLLVGLGLDSMTLIHLAEVVAGRHAFIRWGRGPDGHPVRSLGGECSNGFVNLDATLRPLERRSHVGSSLWRAFPAAQTLEAVAAEIRRNPRVTRCSKDECIECEDAIAGGPTGL